MGVKKNTVGKTAYRSADVVSLKDTGDARISESRKAWRREDGDRTCFRMAERVEDETRLRDFAMRGLF